MKHYLLFGFEKYDRGGGWNDFLGDYATIEEAMAAWSAVPTSPGTNLDYGQIVDRGTRKMVREIERTRDGIAVAVVAVLAPRSKTDDDRA